MSNSPKIPDVYIGNQGTVWTFNVQSEAALAWIKENVQIEAWQGDAGYFVADHRPAAALAETKRCIPLYSQSSAATVELPPSAPVVDDPMYDSDSEELGLVVPQWTLEDCVSVVGCVFE